MQLAVNIDSHFANSQLSQLAMAKKRKHISLVIDCARKCFGQKFAFFCSGKINCERVAQCNAIFQVLFT